MVSDIFDEMERMQEEMNRMFRFFLSPYQLGPGRTVQEAESAEMPYRKAVVDVQETDSDVVVTAELPGMEKEDIELNVTSERLEIKAQTRKETSEKKEGYAAYGRMYAGFYQSVPLPAAVKSEEAKATFKNGVLEVTLPKREVAESQNMQIE